MHGEAHAGGLASSHTSVQYCSSECPNLRTGLTPDHAALSHPSRRTVRRRLRRCPASGPSRPVPRPAPTLRMKIPVMPPRRQRRPPALACSTQSFKGDEMCSLAGVPSPLLETKVLWPGARSIAMVCRRQAHIYLSYACPCFATCSMHMTQGTGCARACAWLLTAAVCAFPSSEDASSLLLDDASWMCCGAAMPRLNLQIL